MREANIWELLATPALEHAVEVWNVGSKGRVRKLRFRLRSCSAGLRKTFLQTVHDVI